MELPLVMHCIPFATQFLYARSKRDVGCNGLY
ncbi:hypothetical protein NC652_004741 [Populus alba x Populus x berolinensis]|nr:hypothetical protein NC652_004741 [Populus alba x Populus x berolinensis]